jgi:hypothetical protein
LSEFADGLRFQWNTRLRAGFIGGKFSKHRESLTKPRQITDPEAESVAQEKKGDCQENTDVKEKEDGEGVPESLAKKENESVGHTVTKKIGVADPGSVGGGAGSAAPEPDTFPYSNSYRSAHDRERHHSTGRCREVGICWRPGLRTAAEPDTPSRLVVLVATRS